MNVTLLRKVYRMHGIKKKKYRWNKQPKNPDPAKTATLTGKMKRELANAKRDGYRVIYLDETHFTRNKVPELEWALPKENVTIDPAKNVEPCLSMLAAISKDKGLEHSKIYEKSVNLKKFKEWLTEVRGLNGQDKIALFMDNLSVHTSPKAKKFMRELGFKYIYNLPYAPEYNPIEFTFSKVKHTFKGLRAQKLLGLRQESHEALVRIAWESLKKKDIVNCILHVEKLLR